MTWSSPDGASARSADTLSRRRVLRGLMALGTAGGSAGSVVGAVGAVPRLATTATVMTRNLGLGANLFRLFRNRTVEPGKAGTLFRDLRRSSFPERAGALADEITTARPAAVGLQEVALVRTERPGDYAGGSDPDAETVAVDFLAELTDALADADGPDYEVAATVTNADEEVPAETDDGDAFDVRLTDRDVLLVREDVAVRETASDNYRVAVRVVLKDETRVSAERGYCRAALRVDGVPVTVATTHLASAQAVVRDVQATELLGTLDPVEEPTVLLGDFNTAPGGRAYRTLTREFTDAWAAADAGEGPTCCQFSNLRNERSLLDRRVDHVLYRGLVRPRGVRRVGETVDARLTVDTDDGEVTVWPSDHAGVVADLAVTRRAPDPFDHTRRLFGG